MSPDSPPNGRRGPRFLAVLLSLATALTAPPRGGAPWPHVYTASIQRVGRVEADGHVHDLQATLVGYVTEDGRVIGFGAQVAGMVDDQGRLFDATGQPAGEVPSDGGVFTWLGQYVGYVEMADEIPLGLKAGGGSPPPPTAPVLSHPGSPPLRRIIASRAIGRVFIT